MQNKYKILIAFFLFSQGITFVGALFKIQSWQGGSEMLTLGLLGSMLCCVLAGVFLLVDLVRKSNATK